MQPDLEATIRQLIASLALVPICDNQPEIAGNFADAPDYATHNECGLALEILCDNLYEYDFPLPHPLLVEIERLIELTGADRGRVESLRQLNRSLKQTPPSAQAWSVNRWRPDPLTLPAASQNHFQEGHPLLFDVILERDEADVWVIGCPSIPGCFSQGETREEALENIRDAIKGCLKVRAELGMPLFLETCQVEVPFPSLLDQTNLL